MPGSRTLGILISKFQNAFVLGGHFSDNIILAHEITEYIHHKKQGRKALFAPKLDMNKAYDRINWAFFVEVLRKMGFSPKWLDINLQCISTVSFTVLVNGGRLETFRPRCGLRQGDPLSPFLFILVSQGLSSALAIPNANFISRGVAVSPRSLRMSHLFFVDASFFFMELETSHVEFQVVA